MINVMALNLNMGEINIPIFRVTNEMNSTTTKDCDALVKTLNIKHGKKHVLVYSRIADGSSKKLATLELNAVRVNAGPKYIIPLDEFNKFILPKMENNNDPYLDMTANKVKIARKLIRNK